MNNNDNNNGREEAKIATKLKWTEDQLKLVVDLFVFAPSIFILYFM